MTIPRKHRSPTANTALATPDFWPELEKKYRVEIDENKAVVWERRILKRDRPVLTLNAIPGKKAVEISVYYRGSPEPQLQFELYDNEVFTDQNVASELESLSLFVVADMELATITVNAGE